MPIKQSRLLDLLSAGEELLRERQSLLAFAQDRAKGPDKPFEQRAFADLYAAVFNLRPSEKAIVALARERERYDLTSKRNLRRAERARIKRGGGKLPPTARENFETIMAEINESAEVVSLGDAMIEELIIAEDRDK